MKRAIIATITAALLVITAGVAAAAALTTNLNAGDKLTVNCAGPSLAQKRLNPTSFLLTCHTNSTTPTPTPTPTTTSTGGSCAPVVASGSQATWTYNFDDTWWVDNDAWNGGHGPQTINACSATQWYAVSNQKDIQGEVETYPNTEYDVGGRSTPSTKTIDQYQSITSTYNESFPTDGSMDAAYDLWLNNWGTEIMVWNEVHGDNTYWLSQGTPVTVGGTPYLFVNLSDEFIFIKQQQDKAGSVDLLSVFKYLESQSLVKGTDVPTQLEYGVEISATNGSETFPLNSVGFSLS